MFKLFVLKSLFLRYHHHKALQGLHKSLALSYVNQLTSPVQRASGHVHAWEAVALLDDGVFHAPTFLVESTGCGARPALRSPNDPI